MEPVTLFVIAVLVMSIVIHEVAHGYAANALGDPTARLEGRLTLNPIPHIDPLGSILIPGILALTGAPLLFGWAKPVPYNKYNLRNQRWGEAWVAAAGPLVNIAIALVFGLGIRFFADAIDNPAVITLSLLIVQINILLALFNLIPLPPLDGSKIFKALLPMRASFAYERFESALMNVGLIGTFVLIFLFMQVASKPFSIFVSHTVGFITGM